MGGVSTTLNGGYDHVPSIDEKWGKTLFRTAAADVFKMRAVCILQFLILKRRLQLEDPEVTDLDILDADEAFRQVLAEHEEVWLQYDLLKKRRDAKGKGKSGQLERRSDFRQQLIRMWKGVSVENPTATGNDSPARPGTDTAEDVEDAEAQNAGSSTHLQRLELMLKKYKEELQKSRAANEALDEGDLADHQQIYINNINIMAKNSMIWSLDEEIANAKAGNGKPIEEQGIGKGAEKGFTMPPKEVIYKDLKRIRTSYDLPTNITSLSPGNMPGERPHPGLPRVIVGGPDDVGNPPRGPQPPYTGFPMPDEGNTSGNDPSSQAPQQSSSQSTTHVAPPQSADPTNPSKVQFSWPQVLAMTFDEYFARLPTDRQQDRQRAESDYKIIVESAQSIAKKYPTKNNTGQGKRKGPPQTALGVPAVVYDNPVNRNASSWSGQRSPAQSDQA
ncbi:hypothetical protein GGS26DRAFT_406373 [Hypomontagnella submonticulosa]|nr:hypothetical protein GGS26DRAFT_406373 [Hypomontagnella submonticulosa]